MAHLSDALHRPGALIRYSDSGGDGPAVVFTHGAGMDHTVFAPQFEAVRATGRRVIAHDLRGHGASALDDGIRFTAVDALEDLAALLDALDLRHPVLVGHSLGGNLSQALVRRHPDRAGGLVVIGATWNAGPLTAGERLALRIAAPMLGLIPAGRLPGLMAKASAATPAAVVATEAMFRRMPRRTFLDVWRATVSLVDPDPAYRTPVPLGLIRGADDRTGNISTAMPRWAAAEGVTEHVIPHAGHVATLDAPEATTAALLTLV